MTEPEMAGPRIDHRRIGIESGREGRTGPNAQVPFADAPASRAASGRIGTPRPVA